MLRSLVGTRIRERRRAKKISQSGLAKQVGISASYLNLIEHNRRGIAGKTLLALAKALDINPRYLNEGADQGLIDSINKAAAKNKGMNSEELRTEEFIGRFPGFAQLIERLFDQLEVQDQNLQALSDKVSNDPFFAEAMHLMLSTITTIRSTADILKSFDDIPAERRAKFLSNLLAESERLSHTAQEVLEHFEPTQNGLTTENDGPIIESFMESNKFYLEFFEAPAINDDDTLRSESLIDELKIAPVDRQRSLKVLNNYSKMADALPLEDFLTKAHELKFAPLALSAAFNVPLPLIFSRLAHIVETTGVPEFGIMQCDGSGAVLYRKQLSTFGLPRYSSACPLWPVYRCLSQPMQPLCAIINMPTGERFLCYAIAQYEEQSQFGIPAAIQSTMIFTQDYAQILSKAEMSSLPDISVGFQCSVCPRESCSSRRNGYLLG